MIVWKNLNLFLVFCPLMLFSLGYITLLSSSPERASRQLSFLLLALVVHALIVVIDRHVYEVLYFKLYWLMLISLVLVFLVGKTLYGSARWLSLGVVSFQPSELAKFVMVVFSTYYLVSGHVAKNIFKKVLKLVLYVLPLIIAVFLQPDLGTSLILIVVLCAVLYVGGLNWVYFVVLFCLVGIFSTPMWHLLREYQQHRVLTFLNPTLDLSGSGYNVVQSLIAIGSGGVFGKGFGNGTQSILNFLPVHWTDFIFAAFAEEWGLIGIIGLVLIYLTLLLAFIYCAVKSKDLAGRIICVGVFAVFFSQFIINVGMNLGLLPVTGIPLPFVSYGGTSLLVSFMLLGLAQNIWLNSKGS